ncbi:MAG: hypothetical protein A3K09_01560, partial [Nitrospinae bacterium RIFCSPLOWO2_12_FULL_47_7]
FLDEMEEDEAADILKELAPETRDELLNRMGAKDAGVLKNLIRHSEETAGSLMVPMYNKVHPHQQAAEILISLKREGQNDNPSYFYVVNDNNELLGYFKLRDLLNVPATARASQFIRKKTPKVLLADPCERVASLMDHERLSAIPVVDDKNILQGIITFDDVIAAIKDIASEDIFTMAGTDKVDPFAKGTFEKIATRAPWLFTTFVGGLISAFVLHFYENHLKEFLNVIFFIPFVNGLAGNISIQGATVIVRGLATGDIHADNLKTVFRSELTVGILNGIIFGVLCGSIISVLVAPVLHISPVIGLSVGTGIILAVSVASLIGSITPIVFLRCKIDPAISTGPIVSVVNDVSGTTIYLTTTTLIFSMI